MSKETKCPVCDEEITPQYHGEKSTHEPYIFANPDGTPHECRETFERLREEIGLRGEIQQNLCNSVTRERTARLAAVDALEHMQWCRSCGEGSWKDCEGGRAALAIIEADDAHD